MKSPSKITPQLRQLHLFIDTNVYLNFFSFTGDDLSQLGLLATHLKRRSVRLHFPDNVYSEFIKNREQKIAESCTLLNKLEIQKSIPRLFYELPERSGFLDSYRQIALLRDLMIATIKKQALTYSLPADVLIKSLYDSSERHVITEEIYAKAIRRSSLHQPPGKESALGDRLHWEMLLASIPSGSDMHIISKDGDYKSLLDARSPHDFLQREWERTKKSKLFCTLNSSHS